MCEFSTHCHGQLWNADMIAKSLEVTAPTAKYYLDILEETLEIDRIVSWSPL